MSARHKFWSFNFLVLLIRAFPVLENCSYTEFIASALLSVCDQWGPIMEGAGASERILSYLDAEPAPQIARGVVPGVEAASVCNVEAVQHSAMSEASSSGSILCSSSGSDSGNGGNLPWHIDFQGVSFSYPTRPDQKALDDISLTIPAGKMTALVGLSGSGEHACAHQLPHGN